MPRKGPVPKRDVLADPVYNCKLVTRFINKVMLDGKKGVAEGIVYDAFEVMRAKTGKDPLEVFEAAMKNAMPVLEVRARRAPAAGAGGPAGGCGAPTTFPLAAAVERAMMLGPLPGRQVSTMPTMATTR